MSGMSYRTLFGLSLAAGTLVSCSDPQTGPVPELRPSLSRSVQSVAPSSPRWQEQARTLVAANNMSPLAAARVYAALSVAQYRAVVDADDRFDNQGRSRIEARRGAVAGASAEVLSFFFPAAAASLEQRVQAEAESAPGNVHPHFRRGRELGRSAGQALVERTKADRFTTPWTGTVPTGPGKWINNGPPAGATFGGVKPYLLTSGDQFRPLPPPEFNSPAFLTDLGEVRTLAITRTPEQLAMAHYWNFATGTFTPPGYWNHTAASYIEAHGADERAATHTFALMHAAMMDALIGCWDAKYHYWCIRPSQADAAITLVFGLPNHPSYPSGHSCVSAAAATVLSHLYPDRTWEVTNRVTEAGLSRLYAGIHYRFDITAGKDLGVAVARWAIDKDQSEGLLAAMR